MKINVAEPRLRRGSFCAQGESVNEAAESWKPNAGQLSAAGFEPAHEMMRLGAGGDRVVLYFKEVAGGSHQRISSFAIAARAAAAGRVMSQERRISVTFFQRTWRRVATPLELSLAPLA